MWTDPCAVWRKLRVYPYFAGEGPASPLERRVHDSDGLRGHWKQRAAAEIAAHRGERRERRRAPCSRHLDRLPPLQAGSSTWVLGSTHSNTFIEICHTNRQSEQCPAVVSLLTESYNANVRYGAAMALGIACAGTGQRDAIALLEPLFNDQVHSAIWLNYMYSLWRTIKLQVLLVSDQNTPYIYSTVYIA